MAGNNLGRFVPSQRPVFEQSGGKRLNSGTPPLNQSQGIHIGAVQCRAHLGGQGRVVSQHPRNGCRIGRTQPDQADGVAQPQRGRRGSRQPSGQAQVAVGAAPRAGGRRAEQNLFSGPACQAIDNGPMDIGR